MRQIFFILISIFLIPDGYILADGPYNFQIGFQEGVSPVMKQLIEFHDFLFWIIFSIVIFVTSLLFFTLYKFHESKNKIASKRTDNILIEIIWTIIPFIILIIIAIPSFKLLKFMETQPDTDLTIKVIGRQWYWTYSYPDYNNIEFDSNMIASNELDSKQKRLLEVDNPIVIPEGKVITFKITSSDVVHSFAIPAFGIKTDAVPGRINQTWTRADKIGVYYGQCSELCGVKHGFMPIQVKVVSQKEFDKWIKKQS